MKNKYLSIVLVFLTILSGCHKPDELLPSVAREGINSVTATFLDGTGKFTGYITEGSNEIVIPIPYYFPESSNNQVTAEQISKMRIVANLDDNVMVTPSLLYLDLTKNNVVTITDQLKAKKEFIIKGEIRKSAECLIKEFSLPSLGLSGVINETAKTISLITIGDVEPALANISLSYHATVSPDPTTAVLDYNNEAKLTVTAHDGVSKSVYTIIKEVPEKINYGFSKGSEKELWANDMLTKYGIVNIKDANYTLAAMGTHLILSNGTEQYYFNSTSGEKLGTITGSMNLAGGAITSDKTGNMLLCNVAAKNTDFVIYKTNSVTKAPEVFIRWKYTLGVGAKMGAKINVTGDLNGNAIITVPTWAYAKPATHSEFIRWKVTNGVAEAPEAIVVSNVSKWASGAVDLIYGSTDINSNYFVTSYSGNKLDAVNGATNTGIARLETSTWGANSNFNCVDFVEFNKAKYVATYGGMHFTYSQCVGYMYDVSSLDQFTGLLNNSPSKVFVTNQHVFGNPIFASGDILMIPSPDGYKLRLYYTDANCRSLVAWEFDCIEK